MNVGWESIIPPITIFICACVTRNVVISFFIGIILAACITASWSLSGMAMLFFERVIMFIQDPDAICVQFFLLGIGMLITFFSCIRDRYTEEIKKIPQFTSARAVEYTAFFIAPLFFIDDYLGILILGFLMKHIAEAVRISKERLAFIVQSLGSPLVILVPISSWAAAAIAQFDQAGVQGKLEKTATIVCDPLFLYMQATPYIFYSLFLLFSLWLLIDRQIILERQSEQHFLSIHTDEKPKQFSLKQVTDVFFTVALLVIGVLVGLLLSGGFPKKGILEALKTNNSSFLVLASTIWAALIFNVIKGIYERRFFVHEITHLFTGGIRLMYQSMAIIALSSLFGLFVRYDLKTGYFLASVLLQNVPAHFLAFITFLTSFIVTLLTGSAWGTYALMIPLIIPIILSLSALSTPVLCGQLPLLPSVLGALFSGGVCGNHLSPFAETTTMTASALQLSPMRHATTQFIYAVPALAATIIGYLVVGLPYFEQYTILKTVILGMVVLGITMLIVKWVLVKR